MTIYYSVHITWCPHPFQDVVDEKYVKFYTKNSGKGKKKYTMIPLLEMKSNTSIEEKKEYLRKELNERNISVIKMK